MKKTIYFSTSPLYQDKTGDVDYTKSIMAELQKHGLDARFYASESETGKEQIEKILKQSKKENTKPVLHVVLNAGWFGMFAGGAFEAEDLKYFKENGGEVIITGLEFKKDTISQNMANKEGFKERFACADKIIFVDEIDKESCLSDELFQEEKMKEKIKNAHVIPVPSTVEISKQNKHLKERGRDILSFGIIRGYKNIEKLNLDLAEKLTQMGSNKKVLIAGSIIEGITNSELLITILKRVFGTQIETDLQSAGEDLQALKQIALKYKGKEIINAELFFDIEVEELPKVFNRCSYTFNAYENKGTSHHFSGVSNALCLPGGTIVYGYEGDLTPVKEEFEDKYPNLIRLNRVIEHNNLADWVLSDILSREAKLDFEAIEINYNNFLKDHPISIQDVAKKHADEVYNDKKINIFGFGPGGIYAAISCMKYKPIEESLQIGLSFKQLSVPWMIVNSEIKNNYSHCVDMPEDIFNKKHLEEFKKFKHPKDIADILEAKLIKALSSGKLSINDEGLSCVKKFIQELKSLDNIEVLIQKSEGEGMDGEHILLTRGEKSIRFSPRCINGALLCYQLFSTIEETQNIHLDLNGGVELFKYENGVSSYKEGGKTKFDTADKTILALGYKNRSLLPKVEKKLLSCGVSPEFIFNDGIYNIADKENRKKVIEFLRQNPNKFLLIVGAAKASVDVIKMLVKDGISPNQIIIQGEYIEFDSFRRYTMYDYYNEDALLSDENKIRFLQKSARKSEDVRVEDIKIAVACTGIESNYGSVEIKEDKKLQKVEENNTFFNQATARGDELGYNAIRDIFTIEKVGKYNKIYDPSRTKVCYNIWEEKNLEGHLDVTYLKEITPNTSFSVHSIVKERHENKRSFTSILNEDNKNTAKPRKNLIEGSSANLQTL